MVFFEKLDPFTKNRKTEKQKQPQGMDQLKTMRIECGNGLLLVPYEKCFVEQYNAWMRDDELQRLTASEPLSMEDEYALCERLKSDPSHLTLIMVLADDPQRMVGDVNLHLEEGQNHEDEDDESENSGVFIVEVDVMVADRNARRKGYARAALKQLMQSCSDTLLHVHKMVARIKTFNDSSIALFRSLGFQEWERSEVFEEVTLGCSLR